jgi:hypothetical protein
VKDVTRDWPVGCQDYTVVYLGEWDSDNWPQKESMMLTWLKDYDHPSWFAWERPRHQMVFEDANVAATFVLKWS